MAGLATAVKQRDASSADWRDAMWVTERRCLSQDQATD